ncbi:NAD(+) diphosphatase [Stigmatella aurantiaca]|uniref:NAD(+) diphosphatase n=1 Tax=Stigmatella aurantiaca (strain DW4/3-1) TaxID=378806 RepID=Q08U15_STIAD|nr:NAD(+) diphosphatase [Stigmatella aurantiaca]ADO75647.1 Hydrolase, NUDIX family [Stigmatella aurantiaca DW4/3-1]EAU63972.1 NADH pyrophosphatase [Stigmatella aurantiaca DW4/3-1]
MNPSRFIPGHVPPSRSRDEALIFAAQGLELLIAERDGTVSIPSGAALPALAGGAHFLGTLDGQDCYAVAYPKGQEPPAGMKLVTARGLFMALDEVLLSVAGRALAIAEWDSTHRFCGRCGQSTTLVPGERARRCTACNTPYYPRISPAVIVLITQGERMLLARASSFPDAFFSTLAGFVEPGESLEDTVLREVKEEVGVDLKNLRYFGSQPWPFGRSLMVGFTAEYAGGALTVDGTEILEAHWYTIDDLPRIPPRLSIARRLIDAFIAQVKADRQASQA